tara:strand:+ start:428 stop:589 length:162 start_codon:yes stop_codon:yes gene_type:complete
MEQDTYITNLEEQIAKTERSLKHYQDWVKEETIKLDGLKLLLKNKTNKGDIDE